MRSFLNVCQTSPVGGVRLALMATVVFGTTVGFSHLAFTQTAQNPPGAPAMAESIPEAHPAPLPKGLLFDRMRTEDDSQAVRQFGAMVQNRTNLMEVLAAARRAGVPVDQMAASDNVRELLAADRTRAEKKPESTNPPEKTGPEGIASPGGEPTQMSSALTKVREGRDRDGGTLGWMYIGGIPPHLMASIQMADGSQVQGRAGMKLSNGWTVVSVRADSGGEGVTVKDSAGRIRSLDHISEK